MSTLESIVIVGGGQTAVAAAETLRRRGCRARVSIVCGEPYYPYQRPPLSKKYLGGELTAERLSLRPERFYTEHDIHVLLGHCAVELDCAGQRVRLDDGSSLPYDALLIATGSGVRTFPG